jgi:hypothetical protein
MHYNNNNILERGTWQLDSKYANIKEIIQKEVRNTCSRGGCGVDRIISINDFPNLSLNEEEMIGCGNTLLHLTVTYSILDSADQVNKYVFKHWAHLKIINHLDCFSYFQ